MSNTGSIAVLIPEFPGQTHIFFWREIQALRQSGNQVNIISTRKPKQKNFHEFCSEVDDTFYLTPLRYFSVILFFLQNLVWLMKGFSYCFSLKGGIKTRLRGFLFLPVAANLASYCTENSVRHLHVHSSADASHIAALASLCGKFTYSVCVHGNLNQYGENHHVKLRAASFIITVTKPLQSEIYSTIPDYPKNLVHVLPMGVDISKFLPKQYSDNSDEKFVLTSVSRLAHVKGHRYALQALSELPPEFSFIYQIVGDGEMRAQLESEVDELGLHEKVVFLGFKKEGEVKEILKSTDVFMLTSFGYGEAAPVAIMEAMACGVASICSIIGGTRDMITNEYDGMLVKQKDVQDIKRAITFLISDRKRLAAIGKNARETAEEKFCHRRSAGTLHQYITLHQPALAQHEVLI